MKKEIKFKTDLEYWRLKDELKAEGYKEIGNAYWTYIFTKGTDEVILNRE